MIESKTNNPAPCVKGRFAPSPSGRMHLGNIFAALLCWLSVKSQNGQMVLRIEDLDPERSKACHTENLMRDLEWLGLNWDEGAGVSSNNSEFFQSKRTNFYEKQTSLLAKQNLIYPCFCTRAQLHAANAPHAADNTFVYNGNCRPLAPFAKNEAHFPQQDHGVSAPDTYLSAPRGGVLNPLRGNKLQKISYLNKGALRVIVPNESLSFKDGCMGTFSQNLAKECGDFIIRRSDGVFAYQLAAPCDDASMGITEVVRGNDLLASTPRQIWLLKQLGCSAPNYFHLPLLLMPDGRRLSKRENDLHMGTLRARVENPFLIIGLLGFFAGLIPKPTPISCTELIPYFNWNKIPRNNILINNNQLLNSF